MVPRIRAAAPPDQQAPLERKNHDDIEEPESPPVRPTSHTQMLSTPPSCTLRPDNQRSSTEPSPSVLLQGYFKDRERPSSSGHRTRSPFSRSHLRSRSSGAALSAPLMTRAHSMPSVHTSSRTLEPSATSSGSLSPNPNTSPMRSPARTRSPFKPGEEAYNPPPRSPSWFDAASSAIEAIQEDSELDITPRAQLPQPSLMHFSSSSRPSSLRRRPASPLHSLGSTSQGPTSYPSSLGDQVPAPTTSAGSYSPALGPQRYNEAYPSLHHYGSTSSFSSIPSTPTSARSRSPSISSLETIEDAPEQESEAIEAERLNGLKLAAERAERAERGEDSEENPRRRSSLDGPRGFGFSRGGSRERKRWSVCGGERRADLDLETIWED